MSNHWINGSEWGIMKADESMLTISADQLHLSERLLYRHLENEVKFTPTTPAQQGPEWAPILSWKGRSGRWGISKWRISSNILNAILAIWEQNSLSDNNVCHLSCMQGPVADREARYRHVSVPYRLNLRNFKLQRTSLSTKITEYLINIKQMANMV